MCPHKCVGTPRGEGALSIYTSWGVPRHIQKGGSWARHNPKMGGHRHGPNPKKRGLRHGQESKKGGLRHGHELKKGELRTGLVKKTILVTDVAQGSLFINYIYLYLVNMINWWGFTLTV